MNLYWQGQLYAIPLKDGSHMVGVVMPPGGYRDGSFRVFIGDGPFPPTDFPDMLRVKNLEDWLQQKASEGFDLKATTMRALEGME